MSGMTNPDNGMMENQQAADLGHPLDEGGTPATKGAEVESPIPHLPDGVDAGGMVESGHELPDPGTETEEARKDAIEVAATQPMPSD